MIAVTAVGDGESSSMRTLGSASETTLSLPDTGRTSVVNSAINERCRVCRGDLSTMLLNANVSGL